MALGAAQESEDLVVDDVAHAGGQSGAGECELAAFPERVLHRGGDLAQLLELVLVHLVESDQDAGAIFDEQIGQQLDLVAQASVDDVGVDGLPGDRSDVERSGHTGHAAAHCLRVEVAQQAGEMLLGDPRDEPGCGRLADDQPAALLRAIFDRIEHDGLSGPACAGV